MIEKPHEASLRSGHAYNRLRQHPLVGSGLGGIREGGAGQGRPDGPAGDRRRSPGACLLWPAAGRSRMGMGVTALTRMVAVAAMAGLLAGPVGVPDGRPDRPRHGFDPWHVFMDWLTYRRQARRGSGNTNERRRNKAR